jgi:hypothetical protein
MVDNKSVENGQFEIISLIMNEKVIHPEDFHNSS